MDSLPIRPQSETVIDGRVLGAIRVCNCCVCGQLLLGHSELGWLKKLPSHRLALWPKTAVFVSGRAFCDVCFMTKVLPRRCGSGNRRMAPRKLDSWAFFDNAVRAVEDNKS